MIRLFLLMSLLSVHAFAKSESLRFYTVETTDVGVLSAIADRFEIAGRAGHRYEVVVPESQVHELIQLAPQAVLKKTPAGKKPADAKYHEFAQIQPLLMQLQKDYPDLVQFFEYGTSPDGLPYMGVKISNHVGQDENEPELMLTAATHGDELVTVEVLLNLVQTLVKGYATDSRFQAMLDRTELFVIPVVNPDGYSNVERYDHGKDPNRSYPWPGNPDNQPTPSVAGMIKFFESRNIVGSIDFHAFGMLTMYPWAYSEDPTQSDAIVGRASSK